MIRFYKQIFKAVPHPERVFLRMLTVVCFFSFISLPAQAQSLDPRCVTTEEAIVSLLPPRLGVPTVWDASYEIEGRDVQIKAGLALPTRTVLAAGRILSHEDQTVESVFLTEINRRGRILMEKKYPAGPGEEPVDILATSEGYLVASTVQVPETGRSRIRVARYDGEGSFVSDRSFSHDDLAYEALSLVHTGQGDDAMVLARAVDPAKIDNTHAVVLRLDGDLSVRWQRAYRTGTPNTLFSMTPLADGSFLAAGYIEETRGRAVGWTMSLDDKGRLRWQEIHPRGKQARLVDAAEFIDLRTGETRFAFLGDVAPLDKGPDAIWLMVTGPFGDTIWQRYYRHDEMGFEAVDLVRELDGRYRVLVNAHPLPETGHRGHIRMLTVSPRGAIRRDAAYIDGIEAQARQSRAGWNGERVVFGTMLSDAEHLDIEMIGDRFVVQDETEENGDGTDTDTGAEGEADAAKEAPADPRQAGWVLVTAPPDYYEDPCRP